MELDILLIEDNLGDAELTIRALKKNYDAIHITHLKNGEIALNFLFGKGEFEKRNLNIKPKVILLDLKMPKVSGLEVLEKIKTDSQTNKIPVVVLTSSKEDLDLEKAYQLGANSYLVKPVEFEKFRELVNNIGEYWLFKNQTP